MSVVWLVLKVIGWLLLGVLALLIFTPFAVKIHYSDELRLKVGAALFGRHGIWLQILPKREKKHARKPKPKKEKPEKPKKEKKPQKDKKTEESAKKKPKKSISELLDTLVMPALRALGKSIHPLFKTIRFRQLSAHIWVASDDAAKTGQLYGYLCAAIPEAMPLVCAIFTVDDWHLRVDADFTTEKLTAEADVVVSLTLGAVIWVILRMGWLFLWEHLKRKRRRKREQRM
ncbi:MAG: DUF2953 domain-containing protein [Clostridia bacterium]|nr:DUF2953 domain-containing protein [Clostridia bacterium]